MVKTIMAAGLISDIAVVPMTMVEAGAMRGTQEVTEIMAVGTTISEVVTTMEDKITISNSKVVGEDEVAEAEAITIEEEVVVADIMIEAVVAGGGAVAADALASYEAVYLSSWEKLAGSPGERSNYHKNETHPATSLCVQAAELHKVHNFNEPFQLKIAILLFYCTW